MRVQGYRRLEILSPLNGEIVGENRSVLGAVLANEQPHLQLLVRGRDHLWHPQPQTNVIGHAFTGTCHFGTGAGPSGAYEIVALVPRQQITTARPKLPRWSPRSPIVTVARAV